jgi:hypothetical protein
MAKTTTTDLGSFGGGTSYGAGSSGTYTEYVNPQETAAEGSNQTTNVTDSSIVVSASPDETPYFDSRVSSANFMRKTDFDITIRYGANEQLEKTIKRVKLRSVSQEIDASGNPVFDVFEFIAQDLID